MAQKIFCDRCNVEIKRGSIYYYIEVHEQTDLNFNIGGTDTVDIDMCKSCMDKFYHELGSN